MVYKWPIVKDSYGTIAYSEACEGGRQNVQLACSTTRSETGVLAFSVIVYGQGYEGCDAELEGRSTVGEHQCTGPAVHG